MTGFSELTYVIGPTSEAVADKLKAEGCFLVNLIGSTETAPISQLVPEQDDFPLFEFEESVSGIDWRPLDLGKERVYEQWIVRKDDISLQPIFYNFPEISAYNTHDLYRKHPGKPHKWSYYGRSDSLIVLSNGEKINPVDTEKELDEVPDINGSLVVGQGRFQAALLVEPRVWPPSEAERERLLELIWLAVDDANTRSATHARIQRGFLMLVAPSKPFPRVSIQKAPPRRILRRIDKERLAKARSSGLRLILCSAKRSTHCIRLQAPRRYQKLTLPPHRQSRGLYRNLLPKG